MKTKLLFALLTFAFVQTTFAQTYPSSPQVKKKSTVNYRTGAFFYPFAAITDNFRLALEHRPNPTLGIRGVFNYGFGDDPSFYNLYSSFGSITEFSTFSGEFQLRYYPTPGNPCVYTGAFANAKTINLTAQDGIFVDQSGNTIYGLAEHTAQAYGFGVIGGLQFQIAKVFLVDAYMGAGPNLPTGDYRPNGHSIMGFKKGVMYNGGINFGIVLFK